MIQPLLRPPLLFSQTSFTGYNLSNYFSLQTFSLAYTHVLYPA
jgi:hypothetical protein